MKNVATLSRRLSGRLCTKLVLSLSLVCCITTGFSQSAPQELDAMISGLSEPAKSELHNYYYELLPTIFLSATGSSNYGTQDPVIAGINAASLPDFDSLPLLQSVQLLKLNVGAAASDLFDLSRLSAMPNLKYVLVEFSYDPCPGQSCAAAQAASIVTGSSPNIRLLYKVSVPF